MPAARRRRPRFEVERAYDEAEPDRYRVLVDRLWPRGIAKADAALDEWAREIAPSTALRRWYGHESARFPGFRRRYRAELARPPASEAVDRLLDVARTRPIALVTATRDTDRSGARVLRDHLVRMAPGRATGEAGTEPTQEAAP
jgi:uncharacterized protein YeaO (DUF488 family)